MLIQVGQTVETSGLRFHRFAYSFRCVELTNAGKRGKKVRRFDVYAGNITNKAIDEILNVSDRASDETTYDGALTVAKGIIHAFLYALSIDEATERGIDVEPMNGSETSEVTFSNESAHVTCSMRTFCICDVNDTYNEGTIIPSAHNGKSGPAKFHKWLRANLDAARTMTFHQICEKMQELGIKTHYYCAVD